MVEVDVFWSYGIGAGFAFASGNLAKGKPFKESTFESTHFRDTLLFLACAFGPSGVALVWAFPDWETMHLGTRDMPHWLVALFAATNVTQGILGFYVTRRLLAAGKAYAAYLQWVLGYFLMFFILVHGWDGSGYLRFFSPTSADLPTWTWATAGRWFTSPVAKTLYVEGIFIVPPIVGLTRRWARQGWDRIGVKAPVNGVLFGAAHLGICVIGFPAIATGASVLIRQLGWAGGLAAFAVAAWALLLRKGMLFDRHCRQINEGRAFFSSAGARGVSPLPASGHPLPTGEGAVVR